jgi:hypothetical protein
MGQAARGAARAAAVERSRRAIPDRRLSDEARWNPAEFVEVRRKAPCLSKLPTVG